jgi:hypothetical protein
VRLRCVHIQADHCAFDKVAGATIRDGAQGVKCGRVIAEVVQREHHRPPEDACEVSDPPLTLRWNREFRKARHLVGDLPVGHRKDEEI